MRTFIIAAVAGFCLLTGLSLSAGAGETKAKIEKGKGELKGDLEKMKGETKAMKEELKGNDTKAVEAEVRAAGTYVVEVAAEIVSEIVRWAGGEAVRAGSSFERSLRDVHVASTH